MKRKILILCSLFMFALVGEIVLAEDVSITISDIKKDKSGIRFSDDDVVRIKSSDFNYTTNAVRQTYKKTNSKSSSSVVEDVIANDPALQELKSSDRKAFKESIKIINMHEEKQSIISDYRDGKIDKRIAEAKLKPFVAIEIGSLEDVAKRADENITMLEKELIFIKEQIAREKKLKSNPKRIIDEKIDEYLGISY